MKSSRPKLEFAPPRGVPNFGTPSSNKNDGFKIPSLIPEKKEKLEVKFFQ